MLMIEFTQEEIQMVLEHRVKVAYNEAYNRGLSDAFKVIQLQMPDGVARTEIGAILNSLYKS